MFTPTTSQVAIGALIVNSGVALLILNSSNLQALRRSKSDIYQRTISASEKLRAAYFDGEPRDFPKDPPIKPPTDWKWSPEGWTRSDDWTDTKGCVTARNELDAALAGLVLVARPELANAAFDLETIAIDYRDSRARQDHMNRIVKLMKRELKTVRGRAPHTPLEWY